MLVFSFNISALGSCYSAWHIWGWKVSDRVIKIQGKIRLGNNLMLQLCIGVLYMKVLRDQESHFCYLCWLPRSLDGFEIPSTSTSFLLYVNFFTYFGGGAVLNFRKRSAAVHCYSPGRVKQGVIFMAIYTNY